jgi:hypothetical protein
MCQVCCGHNSIDYQGIFTKTLEKSLSGAAKQLSDTEGTTIRIEEGVTLCYVWCPGAKHCWKIAKGSIDGSFDSSSIVMRKSCDFHG